MVSPEEGSSGHRRAEGSRERVRGTAVCTPAAGGAALPAPAPRLPASSPGGRECVLYEPLCSGGRSRHAATRPSLGQPRPRLSLTAHGRPTHGLPWLRPGPSSPPNPNQASDPSFRAACGGRGGLLETTRPPALPARAAPPPTSARTAHPSRLRRPSTAAPPRRTSSRRTLSCCAWTGRCWPRTGR